jgi:hypothetical protein
MVDDNWSTGSSRPVEPSLRVLMCCRASYRPAPAYTGCFLSSLDTPRYLKLASPVCGPVSKRHSFESIYCVLINSMSVLDRSNCTSRFPRPCVLCEEAEAVQARCRTL